jgi:hypothetical protein
VYNVPVPEAVWGEVLIAHVLNKVTKMLELNITWKCLRCMKRNKYQNYENTRLWSSPLPPMAQQPIVGRVSSLSRLHDHTLDTPHSVGLLWMSDQPFAETSTWQHTTITTDIHASCGIRTRNPSKRTAADPHLRRRGYWDRLLGYVTVFDFTS